MFDVQKFRKEFLVCKDFAYMNAGTFGPLPRDCTTQMQRFSILESKRGRSGDNYLGETSCMWRGLRDHFSYLINASSDEIALTRSTSDGINAVLWGFGLKSGDEIVTSTEEHPGLLAPLAAVKKTLGVHIRAVPLSALAESVDQNTTMVACSHVSWVTGALAPLGELAKLDVPVLLDGAQALGAIPVDVRRLGCEFYAAPGQKWLCGPDGTGMLYVADEWRDRLSLAWPHYGSLGNTDRPLDLVPNRGASRFDSGFFPGPAAAGLIGSFQFLGDVGWDKIHNQALDQTEKARTVLAEHFELKPASDTTLISWQQKDAERVVEKLAEERVIVRSIPSRFLVRASIGAWTSDDDIDRLVEAAIKSNRSEA